MTVVWGVTALSAGLVATAVVLLGGEWRAAPPGWKFLAGSGIVLALAGVGFIVWFWEPLPGPYLANQRYPLGPYVNAWAVSFGFSWLALGLLFYGLALRGPRTFVTWLVLLMSWFLVWLPHGIIGIGFASAGGDTYDLSKKLQEVIAQDFRLHGLPIVCLRFGHVVRGQSERTLDRETPLSDLEYCRGGWVALEDVVSGCVSALTRDVADRSFNVYILVGSRGARDRFEVATAERRLGITLAYDCGAYERSTDT